MRVIPRWALVSVTAAPVFLIGGWTIAATRQPSTFDSTIDTISALAGYAAADRWIMTTALVVVGVCHVVTSLGLRPVAAGPGRALLALAGVATIAVACFPLPITGTSTGHRLAAALAFGGLALWPAFAWRRRGLPILRPAASYVAAAVLSILVVVFVASMIVDDMVGLTERLAAGAQALWPLIVVWSARLATSANMDHGGTDLNVAPSG